MSSGRDRQPSEQRAHIRTRLIHGQSSSEHWEYGHHVVPPMTSSATFRLDSVARGAQGFNDFAQDHGDAHDLVYIYDRLDEPTRGMLEENLAAAEGGDGALCYASGMAAISGAVQCLLRHGEGLISHHVVYGCTYSLFTNWLPRYGIGVRYVDLTAPDTLRAAIDERTRVVYFETPVNPDMTLIDMRAVCDIVADCNRKRDESQRIRVVVDNTFATPVCQRPLEFGVDVVCHSLTKGIGGF
ncbi:MAG: aminotransferase class I/II-fold pyridoxal phosphate-dependent enzyme, partial [Phycisphaerales bacterium]|nr:aminotransferase class I/II-fold pyridoxal phosphate-dependent enzyme [Phycisphaerales bacterium]